MRIIGEKMNLKMFINEKELFNNQHAMTLQNIENIEKYKIK